ncbi:FAD/NAD(P)-binding protein [Staphylococcus agnetis]|uniref:FAD/NAD(P)-binding protein n=1 Tax=Staphylococcus agnetis TaxID=985762 RepID=UPI00118B2B8C|nr:FAD/NAD(P)-binding protein [Staphylococcus agnetis]MCO4325867.1 FAD/NAD(P)-binding protein [Staphylococcus agnetis]MCO4368267.1 FAD/NAD(P)-binding protein [Staphylococcus agnetis]QDW98017.1 pyridine nucleotide-disulfide oxidoreductase [Staphylococcus agnetis]UXU59960.1 FAD/NAD(P)-binding protein [Staphylococcus agnetis]UXU62292.1 FAD/NAD(P)-binding protein [Staphylococcus agnetis]
MSKWIIIGGGVQATTIAIHLKTLGLSNKNLNIIDPHRTLMAQFEAQTKRIGMEYLRSPIVHHCHPAPFDLKRFARDEDYAQPFKGRHQRPRLDMFFDHTQHWITHYNLEACHIQDTAIDIKREDGIWYVRLQKGEWVTGDHVILAMGTHHHPFVPDIFKNKPHVTHIHDRDTAPHYHASHVVGSGISAGHLTLKLIQDNPNQVIHLWMKKDFEMFDFDADPAWLGPKKMRGFQQETDLSKRIKINKYERHKGSMPRDMIMALKHFQQDGRLIIHQNPIQCCDEHHIVTESERIKYDHILLATGFKYDVMEQPLMKQLCHMHEAECIEGFPKTNFQLEWLPQLYVAGMMADLELGPFARNIMGGRQAALRIGEAFQQLNHIAS